MEIYVDRPGPSANLNPLRRQATYNLSQQCFKWVILANKLGASY